MTLIYTLIRLNHFIIHVLFLYKMLKNMLHLTFCKIDLVSVLALISQLNIKKIK